MNLLARILSHGFAFAVVALIFLVLVYRGDLFQETELPEFLTFKKQPVTTVEADSGAVDRIIDETAVPTEPSEEYPAPAPGSGASEGIPSADEMPAAETESPAEPDAVPDTSVPDAQMETAVETTAVAEPDVGSDTVDVSKAPPVQGGSTPSTTVDREENTAQMADDEAVLIVIESVEQSSPSVEAPPATPEPDASDENAAELTGDATVLTVDETADEASQAVETPLETETAIEGAAPEETTPAAVEQPVADTLPAIEPEPVAVPANEDAAQTNVGSMAEAPYKVMAKAREAFWLRDFEAAEQQYRKLTQLEPDNPDGYGELGNMYFSQGKWDEAAAAYYEAGTRLLAEGLVVEAREMLEVIRGLNGPQANDLEARIAAASASSP